MQSTPKDHIQKPYIRFKPFTRCLYLAVLLALVCYTSSFAAQVPISKSGIIAKGIAVFIPQGYDQQKTPSLMLKKERAITAPLPPNWKIRPEFTATNGKATAIVTLSGKVSLYGGGEVTGPLLRNGKRIKLWNTDSGAYGVDEGSRLYQTHPWVMGVREDGSAFGILFDSF